MSHRAEEDFEPQDEVDTQNDQVPLEDALEQRQDADPGTDDVVEAPEGTFPADAKGFDGTPVAQILEEREERLSDENRPDNTEVSNAGREFNIEKGMFTDEPGFEEAEEQFTAEDP